MRSIFCVLICLFLSPAALAQQAGSGDPFLSFIPPREGIHFGFGFSEPPAVTLNPVLPGAGHSSSSARIAGPVVTYQRNFEIGSFRDSPLFLEWNSTLSYGSGDSSDVAPVTNNGTLQFTGGTGPDGDITLNAPDSASGAQGDATANITDSSGDTASISISTSSPAGAGNSTSVSATSLTQTGGAFLAVTTDGGTGASSAFGAVFDDTGFSFVGVGDLEGSTVTSRLNDSVFQFSQEMLFKTVLHRENGWTLTPKIGPTYQYMRRDVSRLTSVNINDPTSTGALPFVGFEQDDVLRTQYAGLIGGLGMSRPLSQGWGLSMDFMGGWATYWGHYKGSATALVGGDRLSTINGGHETYSGGSALGRLSVNLTREFRPGTLVSFGLFAKYMSDVPTFTNTAVPNGSTSFDPGGTSGTYTGSGETQYTTSLSTGEMFNYGLNLSFIMEF